MINEKKEHSLFSYSHGQQSLARLPLKYYMI